MFTDFRPSIASGTMPLGGDTNISSGWSLSSWSSHSKVRQRYSSK